MFHKIHFYLLRWSQNQDEVKNSKERAKLRMRLRSTQAKLDAYRERYKEAIDEQEFMNKKFEEASNKLKDRLAAYGIEVLNLKKQLAAATIQWSNCICVCRLLAGNIEGRNYRNL